MMATNKRRNGYRIATAAELVTAWAVWSAAGVAFGQPPQSLVVTIGLASLAAILSAGMLHRSRATTPMAVSQVDDVRHVFTISATAAIIVVATSLVGDHDASVRASAAALIGATLALLCVRGVVRRLLSRYGAPTNVIIVGTGVDATEVAELLVDHPEARLHLVGVVGHRPTAIRSGLEPLWLGDIDEIERILTDGAVTEAIVLPTGFRAPNFRAVLRDLDAAGIEPLLSTGVARLSAPALKINGLVHEPLIRIQSPRMRQRFAGPITRAIDIVGSLFLLVITSPIVGLAAIAIKLDDRGPVFYRSPRVGVDKQGFGMFKLRSMAPDADERKNELANRNERSGPLFKVSNDPRITRAGKVLRETSMDELPQFLNVLLGDMSLVGPRPALPEEAAAFDDELQERFKTRPGITGLWQVEARSNASFEAYRRLDLHYIKSQSVALDLQILVATAIQVAGVS
ncbi:MAG: sugar transferase [Acidimicrobiales bacterium]